MIKRLYKLCIVAGYAVVKEIYQAALLLYNIRSSGRTIHMLHGNYYPVVQQAHTHVTMATSRVLCYIHTKGFTKLYKLYLDLIAIPPKRCSRFLHHYKLQQYLGDISTIPSVHSITIVTRFPNH